MFDCCDKVKLAAWPMLKTAFLRSQVTEFVVKFVVITVG